MVITTTSLTLVILALASSSEALTIPKRGPAPPPPTPAQPAAQETSRASTDYQIFNQGLGGFYAPAVTRSQSGSTTIWTSSGQRYNSIDSALQASCYSQMNTCANAANGVAPGPKAFSVGDCNGQQKNDCLSAASAAASAYTASAISASSSIASANYAAATSARSVSGDLQSFTGALGKISAPAVTGAYLQTSPPKS